MKFSIIITCYNIANYLNICMDHLVNQTIGLSNIEIILIDDCSTDNGQSVAKIKKYEQTYPDNIIYIENNTKLGPGGCRNLALQYASGEYVAYCDADDWISLDALEILYNIAKYHDCDVVEFQHLKTTSYDGVCSEPHPAPSYNPEFNIHDYPGVLYSIESDEDRKQFILPSDSPVIACNKIYRRELLSNPYIKFQENAFYEEPPFSQMIRLFAKKYFILPITFYYYFIHSDSSSHTYASRRLDMSRAYDTYMTLARQSGLYEKYPEEIDFIYWNGCYFLPLFNAASMNHFHTIEELNIIHANARKTISDIRKNPYFIKHFTNIPIIGELIYTNVDERNYTDIRDLFTIISH